ncbi:hypothetical protein AeNC1_009025, partial [Aphanomyces euteiches]
MAHPHFFRVNCAHSELFRESYIRCFQNNGLKVIRYAACIVRDRRPANC